MVKPRVHGEKYTLAINIIRNGECGKQAAARAGDLSTHDAYALLSYFGWLWNKDAGIWEQETQPKKAGKKPIRGVFLDVPIERQLAVRVVAYTARIDAIIESTKSLYELADCTLLHVTGPVPAYKNKDKSMAYLYFVTGR